MSNLTLVFVKRHVPESGDDCGGHAIVDGQVSDRSRSLSIFNERHMSEFWMTSAK